MPPPIANDLAIYRRQAAHWWRPRHRFAASLHGVNAWRLGLLDDRFAERWRGLQVVDLGCGGGLISEALARRGARVVGVDRCARSLAVARRHGRGFEQLRYRVGDATATGLPAASAELVVAADLIEHLEAPHGLLREAARLLRPGGSLLVTTLNRTRRARWLAVHLAEGLGFVPRGTHDAERFVTPLQLDAWAADAGLDDDGRHGSRPDLVRCLQRWAIHLRPSAGTALSYAAWYRRPGAATPTIADPPGR